MGRGGRGAFSVRRQTQPAHKALITGFLAWVVLFGFGRQSPAQFGEISKGFKLLDYYPKVEGKTPLKGEITGGRAGGPQANGLVRVEQGVRIQNYLEDGRTNLIATAPECFVDYKNLVAFSAGPLQVETAGGQLSVRGMGFFYQQTNLNLTISNQVETTLR